MTAHVYSLTHRETGRQYIGMTERGVHVRVLEHVGDARCGSRTHLHRALRKYGRDAFDVRVEAELPTADEAKIAEMIAIATQRPAFNLTRGGDGTRGRKVSDAERQAMRERALALTPEQREQMAVPRRGRVVSEQTRARISAARKGQVTDKQREAYARRRGVPLPPEWCAALSAAQLRRHRG